MNELVRPKAVFTLTSPHPEGSLLDAAAIVSTLLRTTKLPSLASLEQAVAAGTAEVTSKIAKFFLTETQVAAIENHRQALSMLSHNVGPTVYIAECTDCGAVIATNSAPGKKCVMTLNCPGTPIKSSFSKREPFTPDTSAS